jgi:hypothetical protein
MARLTPEEYAQKWATRTAAATPEYQAGIQRVTQAPGQAAAAKEQKYQAGVQAAVTSGKWRRNVGAVSLQSWQESAMNKGAQRLASGAQAAQSKMAAAGARILPMIDAVKSEVDRMPDNTVEDRISKSAAFQRGLHKRANGGGQR